MRPCARLFAASLLLAATVSALADVHYVDVNSTNVTNATDLDGNPRISGGIVDIGAYEFQWPQLTITPSGTNEILTWPTNIAGFDYTGYTLHSTTNLVSPAAWTTNSPAPVVIGGQNTVTNPMTGGQQFFRLIQ